MEDQPLSTILSLTDAEDRATLESDLSAVIGDDVALGRVYRLCPDTSLTRYIVQKAINSLVCLPFIVPCAANLCPYTTFRH